MTVGAAVFESEIYCVGEIVFPEFSGTRIMMMPFLLHDPERSVPDSLALWRPALAALCALAPLHEGVGYLTIDEAVVGAGETHRRPGLHVDGIGPDGRAAAWGGGGGYAGNGMLVAASVEGCRGWVGEFRGYPGNNGDCAHLAEQCAMERMITMRANVVYYCSPLAVHEAIPMTTEQPRQFVRVSMPSRCPWYEGYTRNPLGVEPTGPVHPRRDEFMNYRRSV